MQFLTSQTKNSLDFIQHKHMPKVTVQRRLQENNTHVEMPQRAHSFKVN